MMEGNAECVQDGRSWFGMEGYVPKGGMKLVLVGSMCTSKKVLVGHWGVFFFSFFSLSLISM
jgi:hypothetical protein